MLGLDTDTLASFYRACLLHDVGKVDISYDIIANTATDHAAAEQLCNNLNEYHEVFTHDNIAITADPDELLEELTEKHQRPKDIVPAELLLTPESAEHLRRRGIDVTKPLGEIIRAHEEQSQNILSALGMAGEGWIAGHHHDYKKEIRNAPILVGDSGTRIALAEILHLADVMQAMTGKRGYKKPSSKLEALSVLVDQARHKLINSSLTALWVRDEMEHIEPLSAEDATLLEKEPFKKLSPELQQRKKVLEFLKKTKKSDLATRWW